MKKRFGFTLAEVLITLGIIGVVAAMTIPTLIANTNSAKFRSQYKKSLSTLNQAGLMAEAQYDFNYGAVNKACGADPAKDNANDGTKSICAVLNGTLTGQTVSKTKPYVENPTFNSIGSTTAGSLTDVAYYTLADGSLVVMPTAAPATSQECVLEIGSVMNNAWIASHPTCLGFIDVNGKTLPNKEVTCSKDASGNALTSPTATLNPDQACTVPNDSAHMTDIFPVVFHDATVEPATDAAKAVLATAK